MDLNRGAKDVQLAWKCAQILNAQNEGFSLEERQPAVAYFLGESAGGVEIGANEFCPSFTIWSTGNTLFICILGALFGLQINHIAAAYLRHRSYRNPWGFNDFFVEAARQISSALIDRQIQSRPRTIIAGHSAGGATALRLALTLRSLNPYGTFSVVSFGSPKASDDRGELALRGIDVGRWMNEEDNVPFCPPPNYRALLMYALLNNSAIANLEAWEQQFLGTVMDSRLNTYEAYVPNTSSSFTDLSVANFLINNEAPVAVGHRISTYESRLFGLASDARFKEAQQNVLNDLALQAAQNHPRGRGIADGLPASPIPPGTPFEPRASIVGLPNPYYSAREGTGHVVKWFDTTIAVCKGGKSARNLASSLNTAWRRWNNTKAADGATFQASVGEEFVS